ncbi:GFA family protein [Labrys neptuniae]|uniref:GFA family protein n=1 Tax=Labrys neptuniae TaxID=376174 RepID=A0ABV3PWG3_9HYPH
MRRGCLRRKFRYELTARHRTAVNCHCGMCRKYSGSAFLTYVAIDEAAFKIECGTPIEYRSSDEAVRTRCNYCGGPLTFIFDLNPEIIWVTLRSLNDHSAFLPAEDWFVQDKVEWLMLDVELKQWNGGPL